MFNFIKLILLIISITLASCGGGKPSALVFKTTTAPAGSNSLQEELDIIAKKRADFELEKLRTLKEISSEAKTSFEEVKDIFTNKCMNCHDSNFKLPFYGRIFEGINPVTKHQVDGLKAFNFAGGYPFNVKGNSQQISMLKAIRNSIVVKSMPLKSFTVVYPKKKINSEDEKRILAWVDPLISRIEDYESKFNSQTGVGIEVQAAKILELKCFRCHANGNARGGFGGMENTEELLKSKYVSKSNPELSKLFKTISDGEMPPNRQDSLSAVEQYVIRDWLEKVLNK